MLTCTMTIRVKKGYERQAVETLSQIERRTGEDHGRVNFTWLQDETDPYRFLLFEQWERQEDLDAHLAKAPGVWEQFVPALAAEPQPGRYRRVAGLAEAPSAEEVRDFAQTWFDALSAHEPVERMLPMLTDEGLDMRFPDAQMTDEASFRQWYDQVGRAFRDQSHELEHVEVRTVPDAAQADVDVVVVWRATNAEDGAALAFRARQSWRLGRSFATGAPVIVRYHVESLDELG